MHMFPLSILNNSNLAQKKCTEEGSALQAARWAGEAAALGAEARPEAGSTADRTVEGAACRSVPFTADPWALEWAVRREWGQVPSVAAATGFAAGLTGAASVAAEAAAADTADKEETTTLAREPRATATGVISPRVKTRYVFFHYFKSIVIFWLVPQSHDASKLKTLNHNASTVSGSYGQFLNSSSHIDHHLLAGSSSCDFLHLSLLHRLDKVFTRSIFSI